MVAGLFLLVGGLLWLGAASNAAPVEPVAQSGYQPNFTLPTDYRETLTQYATVERPDARSRDIFISPGAAQMVANNSTARLPSGTTIVIEAHRLRGGQRDGIADNIHVAVKRDDWQTTDYQNAERAGDWNFFSFDPDTGQLTDERMFDCFDCHANNSRIDFIFSRGELATFGQRGEVVQSFCRLPDRLPCAP